MTAVFTPDDAHIISGGFGGQARIWTLDGSLSGELVGHEAAVSVVRISPDGATVVTAASDKTVRVWDLQTRRQRSVLGRHRKQVLAARPRRVEGPRVEWRPRWEAERMEPRDGAARGRHRPGRECEVGRRATG
ncbi:MAG: hypothetical protein H0U86_03835 [Chloroflexi bacterium]|nr:hypothetical protein [Chloroflexota bacterium]